MALLAIPDAHQNQDEGCQVYGGWGKIAGAGGSGHLPTPESTGRPSSQAWPSPILATSSQAWPSPILATSPGPLPESVVAAFGARALPGAAVSAGTSTRRVGVLCPRALAMRRRAGSDQDAGIAYVTFWAVDFSCLPRVR